MENDLISRSALVKVLEKIRTALDQRDEGLAAKIMQIHIQFIERTPAVDAVSRSVFEQVQWERDVAMQQLKDHGIPFGGTAPDTAEVVRCKDCKHYHEEQGWCDEHSSFIDDRGVKCHPWESNDWRMFDENDFCSYGERRVDDGKSKQ